MAKKNKIPKNKSTSEMMQEKEETITMEDVILAMDKKEQEKKQARKSFSKKIQNMAKRKDNQFAENQRKQKLLKAIQKVQEENER